MKQNSRQRRSNHHGEKTRKLKLGRIILRKKEGKKEKRKTDRQTDRKKASHFKTIILMIPKMTYNYEFAEPCWVFSIFETSQIVSQLRELDKNLPLPRKHPFYNHIKLLLTFFSF
jgi:hypothetical protein